MESNRKSKVDLPDSLADMKDIDQACTVIACPTPTQYRSSLTIRGLLLTTLIAICAAPLSVTDALALSFSNSWGEKGKKIGSLDNARFHSPYGATVDSFGDVYVADTANHRIQKFSSSGELIWSLGSKGTGAKQFNRPTSVAVDAFSRLYVADYYNNRVQVFDQYRTYLFSLPGLADGKKPCNKTKCKGGFFKLPTDLAVSRVIYDKNEKANYVNLYVVDSLNHRVYKFKVPQDGVAAKNWKDLIAWEKPVGTKGKGSGQFYFPYGIVVDDSDLDNPESHLIYVTDRKNNRIQMLSSGGEFLESPKGLTKGHAWSGDPPNYFLEPTGITKDLSGNYYVADKGHHLIRKFNHEWNFVEQVGGLTTKAEDGKFRHPWGVAVGPNGCVYVPDFGTNKFLHRIQVFCPNQQCEDIAPQWGKGTGDGVGSGLNAKFAEPNGVAVDANGFVYVADTANDRIQKFTATGDFVWSFGTSGAGEGAFHEPTNIAVDDLHNIYVADRKNGRIQVFEPFPSANGELTFVASIKTVPSMQPSDVVISSAFDIAGKPNVFLFAVDNSYGRIHKFRVTQKTQNSDLKVKTILGDGVGTPAWPVGAKGSAKGQFEAPWGIVLDDSGNLLVTDRLNYRIQKLDSTTGEFAKPIALWPILKPILKPHKQGTVELPLKVTPAGIAVDPDGNYYVADEYSHNIFKFDANWDLLTQWGGQTQNDEDFHPQKKAHFDDIRGVAVGPMNGCVYVSDWGKDHRIQVFSPEHQHPDSPH